MRAITLLPGRPDSAALEEVPEPDPGEGAILVDGVALGICGTDAEIVRGEYGEAPPGAERLILGHESLGRVAEAPEGSGFAAGDLVVGIVRRPDPLPCPSCAAGEWDFCRNGGYTERGIKALHGYGSERWRIDPEFAVKLDPGARRARRAHGADHDRRQGVGADRPHHGARARSSRTACSSPAPGRSASSPRCSRSSAATRSTCSTAARTGRKPELVRALGATYHTGGVRDVDPPPDVIVEATGADQVVLDAMGHTAANGVVCLTGDLLRRARDPARRGRAEPVARARERPRLRLGQREPPPLRGGGRGAGRRRPADGWSGSSPAACRSTAGTRRCTREPDDIKVVVELDAS